MNNIKTGSKLTIDVKMMTIPAGNKVRATMSDGWKAWSRCLQSTLLMAAVALLTSIAGLASSAAAATYYATNTANVSVGLDGTTNMATLADLAVAAGTTNSFRVLAGTTAPTGTVRWRVREASGATWTRTDQEMFRMYTPPFTAANRGIAANVAVHADVYMNATGGTASAKATLYEYNNTTGIVGAAKGTSSLTLNTGISTRQTLTTAFNNAAFQVTSGNRLLVIFSLTAAAARPAYLWGQTASATPSGYQSITTTESAVPTDATAPGVGTVTITSPAANTGTYVPGNVTFAATIIEPESTPTCQYTTNGSTWTSGTISGAASPYTCSASASGLTGTVTLNIRATSLGGGPTTGTPLSRTVDTTAPTTSAAPAAGTYGSDQNVTLSAVDGGVGVFSTLYCVDTTNVCTPTITYSSAIAITGTAGLSVTKYLRYRASDTFGAVETVKSSRYIINRVCVETGTVTLNSLPNPITGAIAVTATVGGGASVAQVSFDNGAAWFATGTIFTPAPQARESLQFAARATGSCGGTIYAAGNPTTVNVDARTDAVQVLSATAVQDGTTSILVNMSYCGDKNSTATFQVDYKLTTSGTWTLGTPVTDVSNDGTYTKALTGLAAGSSYDVRMTFADVDGVLVGPAVQSTVVTLVDWVDNPMLHNALRFACSTTGWFTQAECVDPLKGNGSWNLDRKYVGGWGTPGTQYGFITCNTCHTRGTSNIKRVTSTVTAQSGSFPGSAVTLTTAVDGSSDFGDDTAGHNTSTRVCETCHSKTSYHRYNTNAVPAQADLGHYNQSDCIKCHEHNVGFRVGCTSCHGSPPQSDAELVYRLNPVNDTGSRNWGAHNQHATSLGFACVTCHNGWENSGAMPNSGNINLGFITPGPDTGTYNGRSTGGGYTAFVGTSVTATGTQTCSVYCHGYGTPQWNSAAIVSCGACHGQVGSYGDNRAAAPTGVATSKDLSGALTGFKVGKHATHLDNSIAATGDPCALCHNGFAYGNTTHVNGTVNVSLHAAAGGSATFTPGSPGSCSNLSCHGTANWNSAAVGGCDFCHGYPPTSVNAKHASGVTAVNHDKLSLTGVPASHDQCSYCHGVKDNGTGTMLAMAPSVLGGNYTYVEAIDHQDGKVTMNGNATVGADAGYNTTTAGCDTAACHVNDAGHRLTSGGATLVQMRDFGPGSCGACHDTGTGGAPVVSSTSTHVRVLKTGTFGACTDCHAGHTTAAGGVDIPNNVTVGINYSTSGHAGIQLGGTGTNALISALTTEAQICWACHDNATNAISEWGLNSKAATGSSPYNYGTVTSSNWTTATWSSSRTQFAYKSGAIQSTHTANPAVTDTVLGGAAYSRTEAVNTVTQIRCSNCHDVHELARATGDKKEGTPYLRGSWMGNPYEEDGAPRTVYANTTYFLNQGKWGAVPRGSVQQSKLGGYWIDQNNVIPMSATTATALNANKKLNPTATWEPLDTNAAAGNATDASPAFAGLCLLCHGTGATTALKIDGLDQVAGEAIWMGTNGHANSIKGATGSSSTNSFNVFNARLGSATLGHNPLQHYSGMSDPGDNGNFGFRSIDGLGYAPTLVGSEPRYFNTDSWVVDEAGATKENLYHKFSCSKCHNPHASRLPKLMITNCLDTVHTTWDNQFPLNPQAGNNQNRELAQWTSAQNCHRYSESNNTTTTSPEYRASRTASPAGAGAGWNKVTPWKQTTNTP